MPLNQHLIVGPGAIGSLVCAQLQAHDKTWVYSHRSGIVLANNLTIKDKTLPLKWSCVPVKQQPIIDTIWVCCKAQQAEQTSTTLLTLFPTATLVLLHNGMGPQERLMSKYGSRVVLGSTTCGALKKSDGQYQQTSFGQTSLGLNPDTREHTKINSYLTTHVLWNEPPLNLISSTNMLEVLWRKLAINSVINPLTAYYQCHNGALIDSSHRIEIEHLCNEIEQIALAESISLSKQSLVATVLAVAKNSFHNHSSMAEDIRLRRPTEIDFITGYLLNKASNYNLRIPYIEKWHNRIVKLEQ